MAKDVIHVHGEDVVVGEDTAKAYRGVNWAMISIGSFIAIIMILAFIFYINSGKSGSIQDPRGAPEQPAAAR